MKANWVSFAMKSAGCGDQNTFIQRHNDYLSAET